MHPKTIKPYYIKNSVKIFDFKGIYNINKQKIENHIKVELI